MSRPGNMSLSQNTRVRKDRRSRGGCGALRARADGSGSDFTRNGRLRTGPHRWCVILGLVCVFLVIIGQVLVEHMPQVVLADHDEMVQTLRPHTLHPAFPHKCLRCTIIDEMKLRPGPKRTNGPAGEHMIPAARGYVRPRHLLRKK
jgi:hypothetical protein